MINIVLIDDHGLVRAGIRKMLHDISGIKVIGEASSGEDGLKLVRELKPNLILLDVKMPGIGGLETLKKILRTDPEAKVIVISVFDSDLFPLQLIQAGALGYVTKGSGMEEMLQAIRIVHSGHRYVSAEIASQIALRRVADRKKNYPFDELSERELQVMLMIIRGKKVIDISNTLGLNTKTINSYRYRIFEKLSISNDVELTHLAIRHGILDTEASVS